VIAGFTGTQAFMTRAQGKRLRELLAALRIEALHHGDCVGADEQAHAVARELDISVLLHPPSIPNKRAFCRADYEYPEKPYLERNKDIVRCCDVLFATPKSFAEELRSGTWATIREARRQKKTCFIIWPDGRSQAA